MSRRPRKSAGSSPEYVRIERGVQYVPGHWSTQKVITYENGKKVIVKEKVKVKEK